MKTQLRRQVENHACKCHSKPSYPPATTSPIPFREFRKNCGGVWFPPGNRFLTIIKADGFFARLDFSGLFNRTVFSGTGD